MLTTHKLFALGAVTAVAVAVACSQQTEIFVTKAKLANVNATSDVSAPTPRNNSGGSATTFESERSGSETALQASQALCNRISKIKVFPLKGDRGVDHVYDEFRDAGFKILPCLIQKVTDTTIFPNPVGESWGIPTTIGDVAYFLIIDISGLPEDQLLPQKVREDYKVEGLYAYYKCVQREANRKRLQVRLEEWYRRTKKEI
jgi:hypothetical protein